MVRFYVYYACLALVGLGFGSVAVLRLANGEVTLPLVVQAACGFLMVGVSARDLSRKSPAEFDVGPVGFWAVVLGSIGLVVLALI